MQHQRRTRSHGSLAELAGRQHGVVSAAQLARLGYAKRTIANWARSGHLHRVYRGVYAVGHTDLTHKGRVMAKILACHPAVASHWTAAWLWGLTGGNTSIHLTATSRRHRRPEFRVHYAHLAPQDVRVAGAIPFTSLARTLLDLASLKSLVDAARLAKYLKRAEELEDDEGRRLFDLRDFESLLGRARRHLGRAPLDEALRIYRPDLAVTRSNLERDFRRLVRKAGLPMPSANFNVAGYEIDAWWEEERFGVELDVFATHGSPLSFEEDRKRSDDLLGLGIEVTRITDVRLEEEPDQVMERLRSHLARRRRERRLN
jgi:predicted transcriptional regulator of viral defense system/very-short-patch-repair endonuclease